MKPYRLIRLNPVLLSLVGAKLFTQSDFQGAIKQWEKALQKADKVQAEQYLQPAIVATVERLGMPAATRLQVSDLFVTRSPIQVNGQVEPLNLIIDQVVK